MGHRHGSAVVDPDVGDLGLEANFAELEMFGLTVVPPERASTPDLVDRLLERLTEVAAERNHGITPDFDTGATHADLVSPTGQFLSYLLAEGRVFEEALMNPVVLAFARYLLGDDAILLSETSMIKGPGKLPLSLHADQPINLTPAALYCNATYALTDYTRDNGCLCFVPGSHRLMRQPTPAENFSFGDVPAGEAMARVSQGDGVELIEPPNVVAVEAPKGSLVVWHGNTWHGAFPRTAPGLRASLIVAFCHPHLRPQEAYRETLPQEILDRNDERFAQLMGRHIHYGWMSEGPEMKPGAAFERHRSRPNANTASRT